MHYLNFRTWTIFSQTLAALFLFYSTTTTGVWARADTLEKTSFLLLDLVLVSFAAYVSYGLYVKGHASTGFIFFNIISQVTLGITFICLGYFGLL